MKYNSILTTTGLCCAATILMGVRSAGAVTPPPVTDSKVYPGDMCVKWGGPSNGYGLNNGAIEALSTEPAGGSDGGIDVDCPIVHDIFGGASTSLSTVNAVVLDDNDDLLNGSQDDSELTCSVIARFTSGTKGFGGFTSSPPQDVFINGGAKHKWSVLSFTGISLPSPADALDYFLSCYIPARDAVTGNVSMIQRYGVTESGTGT